MRVTITAAGIAALLAVAGTAQAQAEPKPYERTIKVRVDDDPKPLPVADVDITYGGFVKLDALYSAYSDGDVATPGGLRDFYAPGSIPVAATEAAEDSRAMFDMHAKETRFFFKVDGHVDGHKLGGYLEMDFISNPGSGTEVATNAYNPALRRAYISWNRWLFGQDWSTFQSLQSLPDTLDFVRWPTEGTVFSRQPMVRYTLPGVLGGEFVFAAENSETLLRPTAGTVAGATPVTANFVTGDSQMPDLVVRYNWKPAFGDLSASLLARQLKADNAATGGDAPNNLADGDATGLGLSVAGRVPVLAKDDVRFMVTGGEGIGRYVALGTAPDAVVEADGDIDTVPVVAGFVAYRHVWSARWRSSAMLSTFQADNDTAISGTGVTKSVMSARINALYSPVDKLTLGLELTHAERELENGEDGTMDRLQASAMYSF